MRRRGSAERSRTAALLSAASMPAMPAPAASFLLSSNHRAEETQIKFASRERCRRLASSPARRPDFNNMMTAMNGFCELLLCASGPPGDPSFADIMQIKQNANRAPSGASAPRLIAPQPCSRDVINITDVLAERRILAFWRRLIGENIESSGARPRSSVSSRSIGPARAVIINLSSTRATP